MTNINFKNKTVVITRGSKGIGLEITKTFLKHQANVIILARNKPKQKIQSKVMQDILLNVISGTQNQ